MLKQFSMLAIVGLLVIVGCKSDSMKHDGMSHDSMKHDSMTMDACSHCAGVQTATAGGKCPMCGMAVMPMKKN